ncbi:MAG: hypothetical protein V5A44_05360 [Haloarculaceae archaeon]
MGLSNFEPDQLERARSALGAPIGAHQVEFHPYFGDRRLLADAREHDYPPVALGQVIGVASNDHVTNVPRDQSLRCLTVRSPIRPRRPVRGRTRPARWRSPRRSDSSGRPGHRP